MKCLFITLFVIQCKFQNCPFFFVGLIVFDLYSFEISKKKHQKNMKIVSFSKNNSKIKKLNKKILEFYFIYAVEMLLGSVHK